MTDFRGMQTVDLCLAVSLAKSFWHAVLELGLHTATLVYLIIVQDGLNMQDGKISKIDECAVGNKAVQVGIFQKLLLWKMILP